MTGFAVRFSAGLLSLLFICGMAHTSATAVVERPLRTVTAVVREGTQQTLLECLRRFGEAQAFAVRVDYTTPNQARFLVQMWRSDIKVLARNPFDPEFRISFYQNSETAVPTAVLETLTAELNRALSEVEGIVISEQ